MPIDQGGDYLEYLRPFVLQVLVNNRPDQITDQIVSEYIQDEFGLVIPNRTIQIVLKRIARKNLLKKNKGIYRITGEIPDPQITAKQKSAEDEIATVLRGLRQFSQETIKPISSDEEAVNSLCTFLAKFDITCLRAYLRRTAIPSLKEDTQAHIVLVSKYVRYLYQNDPDQLNSFLILVQGHMLANALLCPDLPTVSQSYRGVTFYLDTPLLVHRLGVEGEAKKAAACELIDLLIRLGGTVSVFSHSREELQNVLNGAVNYVDSPHGRGPIVYEARRSGTTKSDLMLIAESIDDILTDAKINVEDTPRYIKAFQIDETVFENLLSDNISYWNQRAAEYDINSVRSIYGIRANKPARSLEKARAVLVTSNGGFARAAWQYGRKFDSTRDVSSVITDFSLANMAWLKVPMGAPMIPSTQLLAFSYAALGPSQELLEKYMAEIDKLEKEGTITKSDHQLLRSSTRACEELVDLTLGEDVALTSETVIQTLDRVSNEIKKKETEKLNVEEEAHRRTRDALNTQLDQNQEIRRNLYWRCRKRAKYLASTISTVVVIALLVALSSGFGLRATNQILAWGLIGPSAIVLAVLTLGNLISGFNVKLLQEWVQKQCLIWLLKREAKVTGVDLSDLMKMR